MNNYEYLNNHFRFITRLVNNGLIPMNIIRDIEIYERFMDKVGMKEIRYLEIAQEMGVDPRTVKRSVHKLQKKVK